MYPRHSAPRQPPATKHYPFLAPPSRVLVPTLESHPGGGVLPYRLPSLYVPSVRYAFERQENQVRHHLVSEGLPVLQPINIYIRHMSRPTLRESNPQTRTHCVYGKP